MSGDARSTGDTPEIVNGSVTNAVVIATEPYRCALCGGYFFKSNISCCVMHLPGECCHYGDVPATVTLDQKRAIRRNDLRRAAR